MQPSILVLNAGSSSIKFALYSAGEDDGDPAETCRGKVGGIGTMPAFQAESGSDGRLAAQNLDPTRVVDHASALDVILAFLTERFPGADIAAVGHRVVHGGPDHFEPLLIGETDETDLEHFTPLAPLHEPHNLAGIRAARAVFPDVAQVACFDTAFHRRHPWVSDTFALPRAYFDEGVRRYGFHGLSYEYVAGRLAEIAPDVARGRVVIAHLGNGASMCGLRDGLSLCSSMGFTALDGLPMGTRCGQVDPGVLLYLMTEKGMSAEDISDLLYKKSGLLGLSGISSDMRKLEASDDPKAGEAIDYFVHRIRRELGGLAAILQGLDALVFTGGIGENSSLVRRRVCEGTGWLGLAIDEARNASNELEISAPSAGARCFVIPTNEELVIARHTAHLAGLSSSAT